MREKKPNTRQKTEKWVGEPKNFYKSLVKVNGS